MFINKSFGFSLIELLIGIGLGLVVLIGMVTFLFNIASSSTKTLKAVRLNYEVETALSLMSNDVRRAGYWANSASMVSTGVNSNPFMVVGTSDITLPSSSCILFTYDHDRDRLLPILGTASSDERFGYRLSNGAIQARPSTDTSFSCTSGNWENLTDPSIITITELTFTMTSTLVPLTIPATTQSINLRYVTIAIKGVLNSDTSVSTSLSTNVRVRNDKYQP